MLRVLTKAEEKAHLEETIAFCKRYPTLMYNYMRSVKGIQRGALRNADTLRKEFKAEDEAYLKKWQGESAEHG